MPSLKVAFVSRRNSRSVAKLRMKVVKRPVVASPTPTVGMPGDSISTISMSSAPRPRFQKREKWIADSQPAVPPPTITIFLMRVCMGRV